MFIGDGFRSAETFADAAAQAGFLESLKRPLPKRPRYAPAKTELVGARVIAKPGVAEIFGWDADADIRIIRELGYPGQRGPITSGSFWVAQVAPVAGPMYLATLGTDIVLYTAD